MIPTRHPVASLCVLALLALGLAACGGGSPTTVSVPTYAEPDLFLGSHGIVGIAGTQGGPEACIAGWGTATVSSTDFITVGGSNNLGAVGGGAGAASSNAYRVHGDRRLVRHDLATGLITQSGGISEAGDVAAYVGIRESGIPELGLYVRRSAGLDDAILDGAYHFAAFGAGNAGAITTSRWGSADFDGMGSGTMHVQANGEGVVGPPGATTFNYGVGATGAVTWQFTGAQSMTGTCSPGGEVVVLAGGIDPADDPLVIVMVRQGTGFSDASLLGGWFMLGISQEVGPNAYTAFTGALYGDVPTSLHVAGWANREGVVTAVPADTATSTVGVDGAFTVTTPGGDTYQGGLSASGRFGVLAGPTGGGDPALYVLLR